MTFRGTLLLTAVVVVFLAQLAARYWFGWE